MNKELEIVKTLNYDKFKCTADKCKFTCCEGWDINVDANTYDKWKNEGASADYILKNVKIKNYGNEKEYFMDKETSERCPMLDKQGLCQIVKSHGEGYLSLTCHSFPRIKNIFDDKKELSLSCACPEVVEIIGKTTGKINMVLGNNNNLNSDVLELKIRETIINIIGQENIKLENKLIISFEMLLAILDNENINENVLSEILEKYQDKEYIKNLTNIYDGINLNIDEAIEEFNCLFLDIIGNYKDVLGIGSLLNEISDFAEEVEIEELSDNWNEYKKVFEEHKQLIENCIIAKVFSSCVSSDIEDMVIAFQMIILEYLLVRYALFLKHCMDENKKINIEDVKDYIVVFSRVIGNNAEAVIEFFEEDFEGAILENGYLCFITLF